MRLYAGTSRNFIDLNVGGQMADLLRSEYIARFGYNPFPNEVMSWRNSLLRLAITLDQAKLYDAGVFVEYQLPLSSKRVDVMITGKDADLQKQAVIIELKQWERCKITEFESNKVLTWVGGANRAVLHPSVQAGNYKYYLQENNTAFYREDSPVKLHACCFLHNYAPEKDDPLFDDRFKNAIDRFPVFTTDDGKKLCAFLEKKLSGGDGMEVLSDIENSKIRPSKKLLKHVSTTVKEKLRSKGAFKIFGQHKVREDYILLDEQLIVYDTIMTIVDNGLADRRQHVIIVKGGAGTGKSVIGLQLLADLTGLNYTAHYATGSKSFTKTLRKVVGSDCDGLFKYFMSYGEVEPLSLDVLIMDEAHRIREKTGYPFKATGRSQVHDLIRSTKVSVFFIDDHQTVREKEIGSSLYIKEQAEMLGCKIYEYELQSQFRCGGSDEFINWVDNTLQIRETADKVWKNEPGFEVRIMDSPEELELAIREKHGQGHSARVIAGFCWEWSNRLNEDKSLINDVQIGSYIRPWNARPELTGMKKGIPKSDYWAYDPAGIDQIGCVYTAQGFEFDYVGVIFGNDLKFNPDTGEWKGVPENSYDSQVKGSENFLQLVKNTYRVLLTRGMKGCYIYFMDQETAAFFKSRMEN